jgi:hypothetical protein
MCNKNTNQNRKSYITMGNVRLAKQHEIDSSYETVDDDSKIFSRVHRRKAKYEAALAAMTDYETKTFAVLRRQITTIPAISWETLDGKRIPYPNLAYTAAQTAFKEGEKTFEKLRSKCETNLRKYVDARDSACDDLLKPRGIVRQLPDYSYLEGMAFAFPIC